MNWKRWALWLTASALVVIPLVISSNGYLRYDLPKIACLYCIGAGLILLYNLNFRQPNTPSAMARFLLVYLFWLALKTVFSITPLISALGIYNRYQGFFFFFFSIGFFYIGNWLASRKKQLMAPLIITGTIIALISIIEYWGGSMPRIEATVGNALFLANYLVLIIPVLWGYIYQTRRRWIRNIGLSCLYLLIPALIFTFSRSGWGGLLIAAFLLATFIGWSRIFKEKRRQTILIVTFVVLALTTSFLMIKLKSNTTQHPGNYVGRLPVMTRVVDFNRVMEAQTAWQVFKKYPLGLGISTFVTSAPQFLPVNHVINYPAQTLDMAHNDFLHTLATQGLGGGILYLVLIVILLTLWWRWWRQPQRDCLSAGLWAAVWTHIILIQFSFTWIGYTFIFWLFVGFLNYRSPGLNRLKFRPLPPALRVAVAVILLVAACGYAVFAWRADVYFHKALTEEAQKPASISHLHQIDLAIDQAPWEDHYRYYKANLIIKSLEKDNISQTEQFYWKRQLVNEADILLQHNPNNYLYYILAGNIFATYGVFDKAESNYQTAIKLYPNNFQFYYYLAGFYHQNGQLQKEREYLQKALQLNPNFKPAQQRLQIGTTAGSK